MVFTLGSKHLNFWSHYLWSQWRSAIHVIYIVLNWMRLNWARTICEHIRTVKRFVMNMNMRYVHLAKSFTNVPQACGNPLFVQKRWIWGMVQEILFVLGLESSWHREIRFLSKWVEPHKWMANIVELLHSWKNYNKKWEVFKKTKLGLQEDHFRWIHWLP
jgi:hypothetical protein